ncbi:CHAT domain-containing protein [Streptomyces luteogriseus]|uniref:CHAT domain-containing protein n=1 Tax=Streptomyces luteogriseus TaxID=68233 RepID=UPI003823081F
MVTGDSTDFRYDAFICSAPADKRWVRELAGGLTTFGLTLFLDELVITEGDVVIHRIDEGLKSSATGILVCSRAALQTPLVQDEYAAMVTRAQDGAVQRIVPVVIEDVELPPLLAHRGWVDFRRARTGPAYEHALVELVQAVTEGRSSAPWLDLSPDVIERAFRPAGPLSARLVVTASQVRLEVAGRCVEHPHTHSADRLDDLRWALLRARQQDAADVVWRGVDGRPSREGPSAAATAVARIGEYLGQAFLGGEVGGALRAELSIAGHAGAGLQLGLAVEDPGLRDLPWETMIAPGLRQPLALDPGVQIYRAVDGLGPTPVQGVKGPLRILALLASPEGDETLDLEDEERRILDAVEPARMGAGVHVRILNEGTLAAIRAALLSESFHVLHLACHARPGVLLLETDDGTPHPVQAEELVAGLPPDRRPSLVVLSGCSTALTPEVDEGKALHALGRALTAAGIPQVLAMTDAISDLYARDFCNKFYHELALAERPEALTALAAARRLSADTDATADGSSAATLAEWPTPALFLRGISIPLYNPVSLDPPRENTAPYLGPDFPLRLPGEFVGRRSDLRLLTRMMRERRSGGILIHGIGGVGKSSLAAELVRRLGADAGLVVTVVGAATPDGVLAAVSRALLAEVITAGYEESHPWRLLAKELQHTKTPWQERWDLLSRLYLAQQRITLLLDSAEANTQIGPSGSATFTDPELAAFVAAWTTAPGRGILLATSRYVIDLPGRAADMLRTHHLGPLSFVETRRLMWRLPALQALPRQDQTRAYLAVGGHPRTLEHLDALLRRGSQRFSVIQGHLERLIHDSGIGTPESWQRSTEEGGLDAAIAASVTLTVHDSLLNRLLALVSDEDLKVLVGLSVMMSEFVGREYLEWQSADLRVDQPLTEFMSDVLRSRSQEPSYRPPELQEVSQGRLTASVQRLVGLGLIVPRVLNAASVSAMAVAAGIRAEISEGESDTIYFVHPWTAERVRHLASERVPVAHQLAARFWLFMGGRVLLHSPSAHGGSLARRERLITLMLMARRHAYHAGDIQSAVLLTYLVRETLEDLGYYVTLQSVYLEALSWLGEADEAETAHNRANFWTGLGQVSLLLGRLEDAQHRTETAQGIATRHGIPAILNSAKHQLGTIYAARGLRTKARRCFREVITELGPENEDNAVTLGLAYYNLGHSEEDLTTQRQVFEHALAVFGRAGDEKNTARTKHALGNVAAQCGEAAEARELYLQALAVFEALDDQIDTVRCYGELGRIARTEGDVSGALEYQRKALMLADAIGDADGIQRAESDISHLLEMRESEQLAIDGLKRSLTCALDMGNTDTVLAVYQNLGVALRRLAEREPLHEMARDARSFFEAAGHVPGTVWVYELLGDLAREDREEQQAMTFYRRALALANESRADPSVKGNLLVSLGQLAEQADKLAQALDLFRSALHEAELSGQSPDTLYYLGRRATLLEAKVSLSRIADHYDTLDVAALTELHSRTAHCLVHSDSNGELAVANRMAAVYFALLGDDTTEFERQSLALSCDTALMGSDFLPRSFQSLVSYLEDCGVPSLSRLALLVPHSRLDDVFEMLTEQVRDAGLLENLPRDTALKWLPICTAGAAGVMLVRQGREDEYHAHVESWLDSQSVNSSEAAAMTALKRLVVGERWRGPRPSELANLVVAIILDTLSGIEDEPFDQGTAATP